MMELNCTITHDHLGQMCKYVPEGKRKSESDRIPFAKNVQTIGALKEDTLGFEPRSFLCITLVRKRVSWNTVKTNLRELVCKRTHVRIKTCDRTIQIRNV